MLTFALFYRVEAHISTSWIIDMDLFYSLSHTVVIAGGFAALVSDLILLITDTGQRTNAV